MSTQIKTDVLAHWQAVASAVPFDSTATIDSFNREIHVEILAYEKTDPGLASALLDIKFQVNKRFYQHQKEEI